MPSRPRLPALLLALLLALALPLGACGKRGEPKPPDGKPSSFPRTYPTQ